MGRAVAALGGRIGFSHVLHHGIGGAEATDQQRSLIADHGGEPVVLVERVGGGAGAGFLAESEVNSADYLALLVEILEGDLHFAIEQHVAVDLDGLLLVEVFGVADRRNWSGEVATDFVAYVLLALTIFFRELADFELRVLEAVVGDVVGAEVLLAESPFVVELRSRVDEASAPTRVGVDREPLRELRPLDDALEFRLLFPMSAALGRGVLMVSREWGRGLERGSPWAALLRFGSTVQGLSLRAGCHAQEVSSSLCRWRNSAGGFIGTPTVWPRRASMVSTQRIWDWKTDAEVAGDGFGYGVEVEFPASFFLHGGYGLV